MLRHKTEAFLSKCLLVNPTGWFHMLHFFDQTGQNPGRHEDVATFRYLYKLAKAATARSKPDIQLQTP